jgi:aspartyl/asparaginyl beta-hydroxylase (cupin superfamily)
MSYFYDPELFPWTREFTHRHAELSSEIERACDQGMTPIYVSATEAIENAASEITRWSSLGLIFFTIRNSRLLSAMPLLSQMLRNVPNLVTANVLKLEGDTHIRPHGGYTPDVLRCHFGLRVPEPELCVLRVGPERRNWSEQGWLIFDDYIEHEVWHRGRKPRYVLLVDVVKPGVDFSPAMVAERFFRKTEGVRFDAILKTASTEDWLSWVEAGEFPR